MGFPMYVTLTNIPIENLSPVKGLTIDSQKLKMAVTSQRSRFSSNGAELGATRNAWVLLGDAGGATQIADLDHFLGPGLLPGKWVAPENLPRDVGGETQNTDIHQVVCLEKIGPLRSRHVSKLTVSNSFMRNHRPENGSRRKCSRGCCWCGAKTGRTRIIRYTNIRKSVTSELWCISLRPQR